VSEAESVTIYTDGACRGNPGLGAWAAVLVAAGREKELVGVSEDTTNNQMELEAAIRGFRALERRCRVVVVTDSQYLYKGMTEWVDGWKRRGWRRSDKGAVRNRDQWEALVDLSTRHDVEWRWVRGHAGHPMNERCDRLANEAMDAYSAR